jgi:HEAT repeat protein
MDASDSSQSPSSSQAVTLETLLSQFGASAESFTVRSKAANQLAERMQSPSTMAVVIQAFMECLKTETDVQLLGHVVSLMGKKKLYSVVDCLIGILMCSGDSAVEKHYGRDFRTGDKGLRLRITVAQALGRMEDQRAVLPLISLLNEPGENYRLRLAIAESLGRLGDQQALTPLVDLVNNDDENSQYLKESAVKALGMLGDIRALEPLLDMFESKKGWLNKFSFVKEQLIEAIGKIGGPSHNRAQEALFQALQDRGQYIRLAAVESLAEVGDEKAIPHLINTLFDKSEDVAFAAANSLFHIGGERLIREILETNENLPQCVRDELESYVP